MSTNATDKPSPRDKFADVASQADLAAGALRNSLRDFAAKQPDVKGDPAFASAIVAAEKIGDFAAGNALPTSPKVVDALFSQVTKGMQSVYAMVGDTKGLSPEVLARTRVALEARLTVTAGILNAPATLSAQQEAGPGHTPDAKSGNGKSTFRA